MYGFYIVNYSLVSNFILSTYSNIKKVLNSHKNAIKSKKKKNRSNSINLSSYSPFSFLLLLDY